MKIFYLKASTSKKFLRSIQITDMLNMVKKVLNRLKVFCYKFRLFILKKVNPTLKEQGNVLLKDKLDY